MNETIKSDNDNAIIFIKVNNYNDNYMHPSSRHYYYYHCMKALLNIEGTYIQYAIYCWI